MKAAADTKKVEKKKEKRKGLGGLSSEKKKLLKVRRVTCAGQFNGDVVKDLALAKSRKRTF